MELARAAVQQGEPYPAIYNAANEVAVDAFFAGRIRFPQIVDTLERVLDAAGDYAAVPHSVDEVLAVDANARRHAADIATELAKEAV